VCVYSGASPRRGGQAPSPRDRVTESPSASASHRLPRAVLRASSGKTPARGDDPVSAAPPVRVGPRRGRAAGAPAAPCAPRPCRATAPATWFASRNVPVHLLANCSCPRGTHPPPRRPVSHRSMSITDTLRRARRPREQNARAVGAAPRGQAPRWNSPWQGRVSSPRARERARGTTAARLMGDVRAATTAGFATGPFPRVFRPRVFPFHSRPQPTYGWYPRGRRRAQLSPTRGSRCGR
jgi:hypothetical protein